MAPLTPGAEQQQQHVVEDFDDLSEADSKEGPRPEGKEEEQEEDGMLWMGDYVAKLRTKGKFVPLSMRGLVPRTSTST